MGISFCEQQKLRKKNNLNNTFQMKKNCRKSH